MINGFDKAVNIVKEAIEYGFHCNDLNRDEVEEKIHQAFDGLASENGIPEIDWEYKYEEEEAE